MTRPLPRATYRLQFNRDFTLRDAARIVPYLHALGISHLYASPLLRARAGSVHGYDIVDHGALNPEIGDLDALQALVESLRNHGMGLILDIVPNHMGVFGNDNHWWLDVLEHGPSSPFADYFDIDWHPVKAALHNKLLLPCLGDHYGVVLENGELQLRFDAPTGRFAVHYYDHLFPIDPGTYGHLLNPAAEALSYRSENGSLPAGLSQATQDIIAAFDALPPRDELTPEVVRRRRTAAARDQKRLAGRYAGSAALRQAIDATVRAFNGEPGQPASFERLHRLLEAQAYRPAYWKVAADEINYRRFFDINELAGLRTERPAVFNATHDFLLDLVGRGWIDGLRIDHPDGMYDPQAYYQNLCRALNRVLERDGNGAPPLYLIAEKILASHEALPADWPIHGTSGYDFAYEVNGLFIREDAAHALTTFYARFTGRGADFDDTLYERKKLIIRTHLSSELSVLANRLDRIAESDRRTRDFTLNGLRDALMEIVACFPVYRTYMRPGSVSEQDRRYLEWAVCQARKRARTGDQAVFDFIGELLLERIDAGPAGEYSDIAGFVQGLQQYTGPVMAKSMEDTTFYIHNVLISLNEVGSDPRHLGLSAAAFHHAAAERAARWPHSLLATSTHDAKRSEDLRQRINVISEFPAEWERHVRRWARVNRSRRRLLEDQLVAPSRNDEYLIYQTLIGLWPQPAPEGPAREDVVTRLRQYMLKAIREAKQHSSWLNPDTGYEDGVSGFIDKILEASPNNAFLADFEPFQRRLARLGALNALSQIVLKVTAPGVPDFYQGTERVFLALVDPDNRRAVDFERHQARLQALVDQSRQTGERRHGSALHHLHGPDAKLWTTWRALALRREHASLFEAGDYVPLAVDGPLGEHVVAFGRRQGDSFVVVAVLRWFGSLLDADAAWSPATIAWGATRLRLPDGWPRDWREWFSGEAVRNRGERQGQSAPPDPSLPAADLFGQLPVAVLVGGGDDA